MRVQLFIPCFVDQLYAQTAFNMAKVLKKTGCDVHYNTNQTCCGQPAFNAGFLNEAKEVCLKFINDFDNAYMKHCSFANHPSTSTLIDVHSCEISLLTALLESKLSKHIKGLTKDTIFRTF